ncbi:MAG TPA: ABC transporter ATP-binding protein [Actinomycetes bacterium]|nr:ABC transporter ATP-binding protein [Actinomycetes bacterium]
MTASVLDLRGVTVTRGGKPILADVDWAVEDGDRWVVLGPNGAGKTTLLQVASTYLYPTRGVVHVLGERLGQVDVFEVRPRVGLASAALADRLPPEEKVRDVVLTGAWAITGRWREQYEGFDVGRADTLLAQLGVVDLAGRRFATLSEGERKRVQIARSLMADPELLLLDEPAAGLDLGGREDLVRRLGELAVDPLAPALVLVTHHVEEVPRGFTHGLLLRGGRVVAAGPLEEVLAADPLSATFGMALRVEHRAGRWSARAA